MKISFFSYILVLKYFNFIAERAQLPYMLKRERDQDKKKVVIKSDRKRRNEIKKKNLQRKLFRFSIQDK